MQILLLLIIGVGFIYLGSKIGRTSENKISLLKEDYDKTLTGNSKSKALEAGRKYYSSLRQFGDLTIYDEQAIANDINSRKNLE